MNVTTTNGEQFTSVQHVELARLVFLRFGRNWESATAAWRRLLGNSCTVSDFTDLVCYPEHTPSCDGWCQYPGGEIDIGGCLLCQFI